MNSKARKQFEDFIRYLKSRDKNATYEQYGLEGSTRLYLEVETEFAEAYNTYLNIHNLNQTQLPSYITVEDFSRDTGDILSILYKQYIMARKNYPSAGAWHHVNLDLSTVAEKMVKNACRQRDKSSKGNMLVVASTTNDSIISNLSLDKENIKFKFLEYLSERLGFSFSTDSLISEVNLALSSKVIDVNEDGLLNRKMHIEDFVALNKLRKLLSEMMIKRSIILITGPAGSGKSYRAMEEAKRRGCGDNITMVALSNTVTLKLYNDYKREGIYPGYESEPRSITACYCNTIRGYDAICTGNAIIDEFSQWSLRELELLNKIMEKVNESHGTLFILGDSGQLISFLGRGCLLYSLEQYMKYNSDCYWNQTEIRRQGKGSTLKNSIENYLIDKKIGHLAPYYVDKIDLDNVFENHAFITGANQTVSKLNLLSLSHILAHDGFEEYVIIREYARSLTGNKKALYGSERGNLYNILLSTVNRLETNIKLLCKKTRVLDDNGYKAAKCYSDKIMYKQFRNDKCTIISADVAHNTLEIKIDRSNVKLKVDSSTFFNEFDFGYALTVNSSQGLDWDKVTVVNTGKDLNLRTVPAFYVAITRPKSKLYIYELENNARFTDNMPKYVFKDHLNLYR